MNLTTKRWMLQHVAERYAAQYRQNQLVWRMYKPSRGDPVSSREIYEQLVALGPEPSEKDVDAVIGNTSWTRLICEECGRSVDAIVTVGGQWGEHVALCADCVKRAMDLVTTPPDKSEGFSGYAWPTGLR